MRALVLILLPLLVISLLPGPAHADAKGVVVRVATDGVPVEGTSVALLTPEGGETKEIALNDEGQPPDVDAGDGTLSGSAWLDGEVFSVSVRLGDQLHDAGRVSWSVDDTKRDLNVTIVGGLVTAEASVSKPPPPQPGQTPDQALDDVPPPGGDGLLPAPDPSNPGGDPVPGLNGNPPAETPGAVGAADGPSRPPMALGTGAQPDQGPKGLLLAQLFGLALGLVAIVAVVKWWWQPGDDPSVGPLGLEPLGEPGLIGPGTPALSDGISVWVASPAEVAALAGPLLATVARHRVVALWTPATLPSPRVFGGPVYPVGDRAELADCLGVLAGRGAPPAAGFVVAESLDPDTLHALAASAPPGVALVVLAAATVEGSTSSVACRRDGERWVFEHGGATVVARVGVAGLEPVTA